MVEQSERADAPAITDPDRQPSSNAVARRELDPTHAAILTLLYTLPVTLLLIMLFTWAFGGFSVIGISGCWLLSLPIVLFGTKYVVLPLVRQFDRWSPPQARDAQ